MFWQVVKDCLRYPGFWFWMLYISIPSFVLAQSYLWPLSILLIFLGFFCFVGRVYLDRKYK